MKRYSTQFYGDVAEIRRDMSHMTGSGTLVATFPNPVYNINRDLTSDELAEWELWGRKVKAACAAMNTLEEKSLTTED